MASLSWTACTAWLKAAPVVRSAFGVWLNGVQACDIPVDLLVFEQRG